MTLLKFNGFEGYTDPYDQRDASDFISSINRASDLAYSTGRNGGNSLKWNGAVFGCTVNIAMTAMDNSKTAICGFAFKIAGFPTLTSHDNIFQFGGANYSSGFEADLNTSGNLVLKAIEYNPQETVFFPLTINTWYYIEAKVNIHATTGIVIVNIDEQEVLNFSGDTHYSGATNVDQFKFTFPANLGMEIDDVYIADNQGTENNDFLGDIRVDAVHPNGAGNYTQFTPSAGSNYQCVDETEMDDSDYVSSSVAAQKDSYTYDDVPTDLDDAGIIALQIKNNAKRTSPASNIKIDPFIRISTTDYSQTAEDLPDAFGMVETDIIIEDPSDSSAWTKAKINACEFGTEVA